MTRCYWQLSIWKCAHPDKAALYPPCCRALSDCAGLAAAVDDVSVSAASGATPEEDLASEPQLMPPDADWALTAAEAKLILGAQVICLFALWAGYESGWF